MKAYICVYRRHLPATKDFEATRRAADRDPELQRFLSEYYRDDRFYDWGDDPSFFCASKYLRDVRRASWGVCRPNVRAKLTPGDFVVFFCGKPNAKERNRSEYFFVGVGTVAEALDRRRIWTDEQFSPYRQFYNVLGKPLGRTFAQYETFRPFHENWRERLVAPYIIFEPHDDLTFFNLTNPFHVATFTGSIPEGWHSHDRSSISRLEDLLFRQTGIQRRLRTSRIGRPHPHINLGSYVASSLALSKLRTNLLELVKSGTPT